MSLVSTIKDLLSSGRAIRGAALSVFFQRRCLCSRKQSGEKTQERTIGGGGVPFTDIITVFFFLSAISSGGVALTLGRKQGEEIAAARFPLMCPLLCNDAERSIPQQWHDFVINHL